MAHDVFISYSSKDKPAADAVCATLEAKGVRCWIAPRDVFPGMHYGEAIIEAINSSGVMVLVFSSNANESSQIRLEVERAVSKGVAIIPVRIEDVAPGKSLEYFIGPVHWLDALTPPLERHLDNLAATVKVLIARRKPAEAPETAAAGQPSQTLEAPPPHGAIPPAPPAPSTIPAPSAVPAPPAIPAPLAAGRSRVPALLRGRPRWMPIAGAAALLLVLGLVWRSVGGSGSAPEILSVEFPKTIVANGVKVEGRVAFRDRDGDLQRAEFDVVESVNFTPALFRPNNVDGVKDGKFSFFTSANVAQKVTQKLTLIDARGHRSKPVTLSFQALPGPAVRNLKVTREDNVVQGGRKGIVLHVAFDVSDARGKELTALAAVLDTNDRPVPARSQEFRTREGGLAAWSRFVPRFDDTTFRDIPLFLPFTEFPGVRGTTVQYRYQVRIMEGDRQIGQMVPGSFVLSTPR